MFSLHISCFMQINVSACDLIYITVEHSLTVVYHPSQPKSSDSWFVGIYQMKDIQFSDNCVVTYDFIRKPSV